MKFIYTLITVFYTFVLVAQRPNTVVCGQDMVLDINEKKYPGYQSVLNQSFDEAQRYSQSATLRNEIFRIPVVIHIVWRNEEENLADSIIQSQIQVLNDAFRLQNSNRDEIRDVFKDVQGDAEIEFYLKDVKRVKTNVNFAISLFGLPDEVKQQDEGGSDAVDTEKHLNIWVCKIQPIPFIGGQVLGYAYPPLGLANWPAGAEAPSKDLEGVVIDFRVFGSNNPNKLTVQGFTHEALGRTTVHEVGHYLGLRHIWGDGGGLFGGDSCGEDDGIEDTPNQGAQSGTECDPTLNTCVDSEGIDLPDMFENYMDYSGEACQNTFTKGQIAHMRSVLMNQRKLLVNTKDVSFTSDQITIYPNPTSDKLTVNISDMEGELTFEIRDMTGSVHKSEKINNPTFDLDVSTFSVGMYMLHIRSKQGSVASRFLVAK